VRAFRPAYRARRKVAEAAEVVDLSGFSGALGRGERGAEAPHYPCLADTLISEPL